MKSVSSSYKSTSSKSLITSHPSIRAEHLVAADGSPIATFEAAGEREMEAMLRLFDEVERPILGNNNDKKSLSLPPPPIRLRYLLTHLQAVEELFEFFVTNTPLVVLEALPIHRCQWELTYRKYLLITMEVALRHIVHPSLTNTWADYRNPWLEAKERDEDNAGGDSNGGNLLATTLASLTALFTNDSAQKFEGATPSPTKETPIPKSPTASFFSYSASKPEELGLKKSPISAVQSGQQQTPSPLEILMAAGHGIPTILLELLKEAIAFTGTTADTAFDGLYHWPPAATGALKSPRGQAVSTTPGMGNTTLYSTANTLRSTIVNTTAPTPGHTTLQTNVPPKATQPRLSFADLSAAHPAPNGWIPDGGLLLFAPTLSVGALYTPLTRAGRSSFTAAGLGSSVAAWGFGGNTLQIDGMESATEKYVHHGPQSPLGAAVPPPSGFLPQIPMAASVSVGPTLHATQGPITPTNINQLSPRLPQRGATILQGLFQTLAGSYRKSYVSTDAKLSNPSNPMSLTIASASSVGVDTTSPSVSAQQDAAAVAMSHNGSPTMDNEALLALFANPPPWGAVLEAAAIALDRLAHCVPPPLTNPDEEVILDNSQAASQQPHWGNRFLFLRYLENQVKLMAGSWRMFTMMQRLGVSVRYSAAGLLGPATKGVSASSSPTAATKRNNNVNSDPNPSSETDSPFLTGRDNGTPTIYSPNAAAPPAALPTMPSMTGRPLEAVTSTGSGATSGSRTQTPVREGQLPSPRNAAVGGVSPLTQVSISPSPTATLYQQNPQSPSGPAICRRIDSTSSKALHAWALLLEAGDERLVGCLSAAMKQAITMHEEASVAALRQGASSGGYEDTSSGHQTSKITPSPKPSGSSAAEDGGKAPPPPPMPLPIDISSLPSYLADRIAHVFDREEAVSEALEAAAIEDGGVAPNATTTSGGALAAPNTNNSGGGLGTTQSGLGMTMNSNIGTNKKANASITGGLQPNESAPSIPSKGGIQTGRKNDTATKQLSSSSASSSAFPSWAENNTKALLALLELCGNDNVLFEGQDPILDVIVGALLGVKVSDFPNVGTNMTNSNTTGSTMPSSAVPKKDSKTPGSDLSLAKLVRSQGPLSMNDPLSLPRRHLLSDQLIRFHAISEMSSYHLLTQLLPKRTLALEAVGWCCDQGVSKKDMMSPSGELPYRPVSVGGPAAMNVSDHSNITQNAHTKALGAQSQTISKGAISRDTPAPLMMPHNLVVGSIPIWFGPSAGVPSTNTTQATPPLPPHPTGVNANNKPTLPSFTAPQPRDVSAGRGALNQTVAPSSLEQGGDLNSVQRYQKELSVASKIASTIGPAATMMGEEGAKAILAYFRQKTRRMREIQRKRNGKSSITELPTARSASTIAGLVDDSPHTQHSESAELRQIVAEIFMLMVRLWRANTLRRVLVVPEQE